MERLIIKDLIYWKNKATRKPLVIRGARQIGKTWIVKKFGESEFKNFIYINCDSNQKAQEIFAPDFDIGRILRSISALSGKDIKAGETLIFFDEVQEIPRIIQSLKYFCEDAPEYHVVVAGSLLGIHEHKNISFPVGKIESLQMYPMNFSEFVLAAAGKQMFDVLTASPLEQLNDLHSTFVELLRQYYFTGGMPEAVKAFIDGKSPMEVRAIQKQILSDYSDDISKHADSGELIRIDQVWNSIPAQLSKENKKFVYGNIAKGSRAKEFEKAIQWLCNCGSVSKVKRISKGQIPLKFYEDFDAFKLYIFDCGLMGALMDAPASQILIGNSIFEEYKGSFTESFVMQEFFTILDSTLYYFSAENSRQELDFIFQKEDKIIPVEVKAEENLRAKSLHQFFLDNNIKGVRISMSPYRKQDWMTNLPLYAAERILEV